MTRAAFDRLLRGDPAAEGERPIVRGDRAAVAALKRWTDRARAKLKSAAAQTSTPIPPIPAWPARRMRRPADRRDPNASPAPRPIDQAPPTEPHPRSRAIAGAQAPCVTASARDSPRRR